MNASRILEELRLGFNKHVSLQERRPKTLQVSAPLFHEDGDMIDIFIDVPLEENAPLTVSDHGMTLMRLSYTFDVETPARRKVLDGILRENRISEDRGRLFLQTSIESLYPSLLQLAQTISKVGGLNAFSRDNVASMFFEDLRDFIETKLTRFGPAAQFHPLPDRTEIEVDWRFDVQPRNIFLFGVQDNNKARLTALTCREMQIARLPHRSVVVHEDFESGLSKKDQARITNAADKQFASLLDFKRDAEPFFERETEAA